MAHPTSLASLQFSIACGASGDLIVDYHPDSSLGPYVQVDVPHTSHASLPCKLSPGTTSQRHLNMLVCVAGAATRTGRASGSRQTAAQRVPGAPPGPCDA